MASVRNSDTDEAINLRRLFMIQLFFYDHEWQKYTETRGEVETHGLSEISKFEADLDWAIAYAVDFGDMIVLYPTKKGE
jgi:hypothetical protein